MDPNEVNAIVNVLKDQVYFQQMVDREILSSIIGLITSGVLFTLTLVGYKFFWDVNENDYDESFNRAVGGLLAFAIVLIAFGLGINCFLNYNYPEVAVINSLFS